jgi:hypothetical protein
MGVLFYIPALLLARFYWVLSRILMKSARKTFGGIGGYRSKVALKLNKRAHIIMHEVIVDTTKYATQVDSEELMKAIDSDTTIEYVLKCEQKLDAKDQTVWLLKPLSAVKQAQLQDQLYDVEGMGKARKERLLTGTRMLELLKGHLVGWKNFLDKNGDPVKFDKDNVTASIDRIPAPYRQELADAIAEEGEVDEGEE